MRAGSRRYRRGFSLVELLVSVVILSLGLIGLSQLHMAAMWTYYKTRDLSIATQRAQLELEKAQNLGFNLLDHGTLVAADPAPTCYSASEYSLLTTGRGVQFQVPSLPAGVGTVKIAKFTPGGVPKQNLITVTIEITWDGPPRARSHVKIFTMLANK